MFAHKLTVFEQGVGGNWPYDPTFLLSMNHKMLKTRWVSLLKLTLWNTNGYIDILDSVNREYTYIEA